MSTLLSSLLSLRWTAFADADAEPLPALCYPLPCPPRVAALGWRFQPAAGLVCLERWSARSLEDARPEALAASPEDLRLVAALRQRGVLRLPRLAYPLVALLDASDSPLSEPELEHLWTAFGLPIRQQVRDRQGRLLAYDCEAAEGFHLAHPGYPLAGLWTDEHRCGCGDPAPLLRPVPAGLAREATAIL